MLLQRADGFHQRPFKIRADAHYFSRCFHLGGQGAFRRNKFIKGQSGNFYHAIVQHGFKAGIGFPGDGIFNFIQRVAQGNFSRHLRNGISGGFACQGGGTADTGIHLNHAVLKAFRVQGILNIASAGNIQFRYNIQCGGAEHLIFFI